MVDPRTPVLIGGGQVNRREAPVEPVDLIALAARAAAEEAGAAGMLSAVDSIGVVRMLSWKYLDPGALLAERIGAHHRRSSYTADGGSNPQALVNRAAADIASGRSDVALIGGAEAWRTRMRLRAEGLRPDWTVQGADVTPAPLALPDDPMKYEGQTRIGLDRPAYVYPLFEEAIRQAAGRTRDEHLQLVGKLWARFSEVAAENPNAWLHKRHSPEEILTSSEHNRVIASPYTKLLNSNNAVEQGAALLLCSAEAARRHGVPRDRWIFLHGSVEANDRHDLGERVEFHRSPAIRLAGERLFADARIAPEEIDLVDLYSCFPSAVQVAAMELGLPLADPSRALTVTGGLTFAGGPWNNYGTHAIATMATRLRERGEGAGLTTGNSWYLTKHALAIYAVDPPASPFRWQSVQDEVDRLDGCPSLPAFEGDATIDVSTVVHDRTGEPEFAVLGLFTDAGERCFARVDDDDDLSALLAGEADGHRASVDAAGVARLAA
jgi:acetyl-CoA C-acetyltransferase